MKRVLLSVLVCALLGAGFAASAASTDDLNLPQELPDGSRLVSVKDVFTEVADAATAEQLRAYFPGVLSGSEYRYLQDQHGNAASDWGILVFAFADQEAALRALESMEENTVGDPQSPAIASAFPVVLRADVVFFPWQEYVLALDDYTVAAGSLSDSAGGLSATEDQRPSLRMEVVAYLVQALGSSVSPTSAASDSCALTSGEGDGHAWPMEYGDAANSRSTSATGPDCDRVALKWQWRTSDFKDEDGREVFDVILNVSAPLVSEEYVILAVYGIASGFFMDFVDMLLEYGEEMLIPPSLKIMASKVYCIDRDTGELVWSRGTLGHIGAIALTEDEVFISVDSDYLNWQEAPAGGIAVLQMSNGDPVWQNRGYEPHALCNLVVTEDAVVGCLSPRSGDIPFSTLEAMVVALGRDDGKELWSYYPRGLTRAGSVSFAICGDTLAVSVGDTLGLGGGSLVLLRGREMAASTQDYSGPISEPVFADSRTVVVEDGEALYVSTFDGDDIRVDTFTGNVARPAVHGGRAVYVTHRGLLAPFSSHSLECYDLKERIVVWKASIPLTSVFWWFGPSSPIIAGGNVFLVYGRSAGGYELRCYSLDSGKLRCTTAIPKTEGLAECVGTPCAADDELFVTLSGAGDLLSGDKDFAVLALTSDITTDLVPSSLSWLPETPRAGDRVSFVGGLRSSGEPLPTEADCLLKVDGTRVAVEAFHGVDQNPTVESTFSEAWIAREGSHQISLVVDPADAVAETNEGNNEVTKTIQVLPARVPEPETTSSATVLVIDISGSMKERDPTGVTKMEAARTAAEAFINMLADENRVTGASHRLGIVTFTNTASRALELTTDTSKAQSVVETLQAQTGTNMAQALTLANDMLSAADPKSKRIIVLLSDGVPTVSGGHATGGTLTELQNEVLVGPVAAAALNGTCIFTVGFGRLGDTIQGYPSIDPVFLSSVALATRCGKAYAALDADDLRGVYIELRHSSLGTVRASSTGTVKQGETVTVGTVDVPANQKELHFTLDWRGSRLDPILIDPTGARVASGYPGADISVYPSMAHITVLNPAPGKWELQAFGADVPEGSLDYHAVLSTRGEAPSGILELLSRIGAFLLALLLAVLAAAFAVP